MTAPVQRCQPSIVEQLRARALYFGKQQDRALLTAGADEIASLQSQLKAAEDRIETTENALREIDAIISDWERIMCLPGAKELKKIWNVARAALQPVPEAG